MNTYFNIIVSIIFVVISVVMLIKWNKVRDKVMIKDQQWSFMRILFATVGLLTLFSLAFEHDAYTALDYIRAITTLLAVVVFLLMRDGIGEEGIVSGSTFIPWHRVRGWDTEEKKRVTAVFFQVDNSTEKKPDSYMVKELDFAHDDDKFLKEFLDTNVRGKKMRMKKR